MMQERAIGLALVFFFRWDSRAQRRHWPEDRSVARKRIRFRWARGWSRACCWCLRTSRHAVPRHDHNGGGWAEM